MFIKGPPVVTPWCALKGFGSGLKSLHREHGKGVDTTVKSHADWSAMKAPTAMCWVNVYKA